MISSGSRGNAGDAIFYDYGMAIETPRYTVVKKSGRIELRSYDAYITASVEINADTYNAAANKAFRILADYIFGNNTKRTKIAMTAPVINEKTITSEKIAMTAPVMASEVDSQTYVISFTMPSIYTMDDLPLPNNKTVKISRIPEHKAAVIVFSGYTTEGKIKKKQEELMEWARVNRIMLEGKPAVSRYDPPWKPGIIRRNEISYKLK